VKALLAILVAGKLGKLLISGGSMLVSLGLYATLYGWKFAAGFIGLLFAHEMGHYLAAKQRGLRVGAPTFIPFVGAWIELKEQPMNAETEAFIGIAGPMLGSLVAFICWLYGRSTGSDLLVAISYSGFVLNLFNLIPVSPLDGGRIVSVISPKIWLLGIPVLVGLFFFQPNPLLLIVVAIAIPHVWRTLRSKEALNSRYYETPQPVRVQYAAQYLMLAGGLAVIAFDVHEGLGIVRGLSN
jgi:Zn-dependent protease